MSERLTEQVWFKDVKGNTVGHLNANGFEYFIKDNVSQQKVVNKLGQFEDLMEENKFDSLAQLHEYISNLQDTTDCSCYVDELRKENKKLKQELHGYKNRWEKLERYITDRHNIEEKNAVAMTDILYKMRELEKESEDD